MTHMQHNILYRQSGLPIFQNRMYDSEAEARTCPKGDMCLVEDLRTGLLYNAAFRPELMIYDAHYQNEQGRSALFKAHLESVADIISRHMGDTGLVEVGCGKGLFLEMLLDRGVDVTGFDPTYEGTNPRVVREYFAPGVDIHARGLIMRHVLEHVPDPVSFLGQLREANRGGGLIYIEVPCFDWICARRAWFDIFYEHVNYFRISDFHRMFGNVLESGRVFGGQYLYVVADLASLREPEFSASDRASLPDDFMRGIEEPLSGLQQAAVWGGASKGVIFSLLKERCGSPVKTVIDINPAKQGKYLPATGLLVQSPAQAMEHLPPASTIYVMNSNYLEEIKAMSNNAYSYVVVDRG